MGNRWKRVLAVAGVMVVMGILWMAWWEWAAGTNRVGSATMMGDPSSAVAGGVATVPAATRTVGNGLEKTARLAVYVYRLELGADDLAKVKQSLAESPESMPRFEPRLRGEGLVADVNVKRWDGVPLDADSRRVTDVTFFIRRPMFGRLLMVATRGELEVSLAGVKFDAAGAGELRLTVALGGLHEASEEATPLDAAVVSPFRCEYVGAVRLGKPVVLFTDPGADKCVYMIWLRLTPGA